MAFVDEFGLTVDEIIGLKFAAENVVDAEKTVLSRQILHQESPETSIRIRDAIVANWSKAFSKAGQASLVLLWRDGPEEHQSLEGVLTNVLVDPVMHRSVVTWCFFLALMESSVNFQFNHCSSPTEEGQLSGMLLAEISGQCEVWRKIATEPLDRVQANLSLERIDLSILGGEQETGGDFGLILEFDEKAIQSVEQDVPFGVRIVPLIFQAKRYIRPHADISQKHPTRGFQYDLLTQNQCASAYVFYENTNRRLQWPMPPLIKPASEVSPPPSRTAVFQGSLDLPSYMFRALFDDSFAPGAKSSRDALRMIYGSAQTGQLAHLAVISNSRDARERYTAALARFREDVCGLQKKENYDDPRAL